MTQVALMKVTLMQRNARRKRVKETIKSVVWKYASRDDEWIERSKKACGKNQARH